MFINLVARSLVFLAGVIVTSIAIFSAVQTFVLPRSANDPVARLVFRNLRRLFDLLSRRASSYHARDRIMALYAPFGVLALLPAWLFLVLLGYTAMFWASGVESWYQAFKVSGSSLLTLGFATADRFGQALLEYSEATIGLMMVALLIA